MIKLNIGGGAPALLAALAVPAVLLFLGVSPYYSFALLPGANWVWGSPFSPTHTVVGAINSASCWWNRSTPYLALTVRSQAGMLQFYQVQSPRHCVKDLLSVVPVAAGAAGFAVTAFAMRNELVKAAW